jgi:hypothetical protein
MDENSKAVYDWYKNRSALTSRMFDVLVGTRKHLLVAIVGKQGVGKTSYAYYALKTALVAWLCIKHGGGGDCLEAVEKAYGPICMNRYCDEPDGIDIQYKLAIYTGTQGLMNLIKEVAELGKELASGGSVKRRVYLLDDIVARTAFHLGGVYRKAYFALRELLRVSRTLSSIVIMTAPTTDYLPPDIAKAGELIVARYGYNTRLYEKLDTEKIRRFIGGKEVLVKALVKDYIDEVPARAIFGLPQWLDREIIKRKGQLLADLGKLISEGGGS